MKTAENEVENDIQTDHCTRSSIQPGWDIRWKTQSTSLSTSHRPRTYSRSRLFKNVRISEKGKLLFKLQMEVAYSEILKNRLWGLVLRPMAQHWAAN